MQNGSFFALHPLYYWQFMHSKYSTIIGQMYILLQCSLSLCLCHCLQICNLHFGKIKKRVLCIFPSFIYTDSTPDHRWHKIHMAITRPMRLRSGRTELIYLTRWLKGINNKISSRNLSEKEGSRVQKRSVQDKSKASIPESRMALKK